MKTYIYLAAVTLLFIASSCTKSGYDDQPPINNPSGDYSYTSTSKYYSNINKLEYEGISLGNLYVNWYEYDDNVFIAVTPNIGYSYTIKADNLTAHGDTTTFRINSQVIYLNESQFNLRGTNSITVGDLGNFDGYFIKDKQIEYAFRSSNIESYEITETSTIGTKRN